jgi:hypothetical protein
MCTFETSIYINDSILERLDSAVTETRLHRSRIIALIMKKIVKSDLKKLARGFTKVLYQKPEHPDSWNTIHINITPGEYEHFLDMRKVCKMSVSLLVAYGVRKYLDKLIAEILENPGTTDNYGLNNYAIEQKTEEGVISWIFHWGIPKKLVYT